MLNFKLLNIHDIILIGAIAVIVHYIAHPLYQRIDGNNDVAN